MDSEGQAKAGPAGLERDEMDRRVPKKRTGTGRNAECCQVGTPDLVEYRVYYQQLIQPNG